MPRLLVIPLPFLLTLAAGASPRGEETPIDPFSAADHLSASTGARRSRPPGGYAPQKRIAAAQDLPLIILFALLLTVAAAAVAQAEEKSPVDNPPVAASTQEAQHLDVRVRVQRDYLLYLPKDYTSREKWPLILFLHGSGERGSDLELVKVHGPPKLIAAGEEFPFIVVSPQCPRLERGWSPLILSALLDDIEAKHRVDRDRIYLTGLSMGGFGTWSLATSQPHRFAAIAPICGGGDPDLAERIAHLPIWVFHGAKDEAVPLEKSQEMVDALKKAGGAPKFTIYADAEHDSWTETYANPRLYEWFLEHTRKGE